MHIQPGQSRFSLRVSLKVLLAGLLITLVPAGALYAASQNTKPGIAVQISPASQSVQQGATASYLVSLTSTGGFTGTVGLTAAGLPGGSTATFSPASLTLASAATSTATLNVSTSSDTPAATNTLTITGTSGKVNGSVTAGLTVSPRASADLSITATPASVTVQPGATAAYTLQLARSSFIGPVTISVPGGLPAGATATSSPNPVTGASSTLQIATAAGSSDGKYNLDLVGSGQDASGKTHYAYANVQLVLDSKGKSFGLSGNTPGLLSPGTSAPLDLQIFNPNNKSLSLANISVTLAGVNRTAEAISANLPCTVADYTVTQYSGPYPLSAPPGTSSLSGAGVAPSNLPRIGMLDTASNQDGCKGATLQLSYSGSGQGK